MRMRGLNNRAQTVCAKGLDTLIGAPRSLCTQGYPRNSGGGAVEKNNDYDAF